MMKNNTILCGEYPVRILFNDDRTLAWINLHDLCKVLGREELLTNREAIRQLPSSIQIPFRKKGREMWAISPYDVYKLIRPMRRENSIAAGNAAKVETWLNELLEESAIQAARAAEPVRQEDVVFNYQDHPISFRAANNKMMVNATQMARSFGILPAEILRKADFVRYRQHLVDKGISESLDSQIFTTRGRNNGATWIEEELALEFARQLSPDFSAWCNTKVNELMTRGYATLENHPAGPSADTTENLPVPQNLDDAQKLIVAQRHEIHLQKERIEADAYKVEFYDNLIEGRDFYSTTWLAQELNTTPRQLHQFLAEKGICKFEKNQWVAFLPYRQWQIDTPYYWTNHRTGKCHAAGTRKRWSKVGRDLILELWSKEPPKQPELPAGRRRVEDPYKHLREGVDYFAPTQLAREIGISAGRMRRFLERCGVCRFVKKQWAVLPEFQQWQIDVPYYWTNPKTGKRWAFGTRKRWTLLGREKIIELWNNRDFRPKTEGQDELGVD